MDRRDFITSLLAGGILGTSAWSVQAATLRNGTKGPVGIVLQGDLAPAVGLGDGLRQAFSASGLDCRVSTLDGGELASSKTVATMLPSAPGARLLGVMDDASALIFQALAATRGAATVAVAHHRFAAGRAGLCCDAPGLETRLRWNDALPLHANRIGRLYAALLGGTLPAADIAMAPIGDATANDTAASLVSFLITT